MSKTISEFEVIEILQKRCGGERRGPSGIGDDGAVVSDRFDVIVTDMMNEGVHFDSRFCAVGDISWRCLAANLSDLAAMGARPGPFTLALGIPSPGPTQSFASELADGLFDCLAQHSLDGSCVLVGGDTTRASSLSLTITCLGASDGRVLTRGTATTGDSIMVVGCLGESAAGLHGLANGNDVPKELRDAFLRPVAPWQLAARLAASGVVTSAIDLSDGLGADLPRLLASRGASIDLGCLPLSPTLVSYAHSHGLDPSALAVHGGEDYTLLFTVSADDLKVVELLARESGAECTILGRVTEDEEILWMVDGRPQPPPGLPFAHF